MPDLEGLQRFSKLLTILTSDPGRRAYSTVIVAGKDPLLLAKNGKPILRVGIDLGDFPAFETGLNLIQKFVENTEDVNHFSLIYDDALLARSIEFLYLQIGLQGGERCMYAISADDVESPESIRVKMDSFGIDTSYYTRSGQLVFVRILDPAKDPQGFISGCQRMVDSLPLYRKDPRRMRVVIHAKYQLKSTEEINGHSEYENVFDSLLADFHGSVLCNHYIGDYNLKTHHDWMKSVLQNHAVSLVTCSERTMPLVFGKRDSSSSYPYLFVGKHEEEIRRFKSEIQRLPQSELERDISEIKYEIDFLVSQVKADLGNYAPSDLQSAIEKISLFMRKEEAMEARRQEV